MTYELAKQLKDAGFPQKVNAGDKYFEFISHAPNIPPQQAIHTTFIEGGEWLSRDTVKIPTLSELIEACDNQPGFNLYHSTGGTWFAGFEPDMDKASKGKTPEEAVAKLWLALKGVAVSEEKS